MVIDLMRIIQKFPFEDSVQALYGVRCVRNGREGYCYIISSEPCVILKQVTPLTQKHQR